VFTSHVSWRIRRQLYGLLTQRPTQDLDLSMYIGHVVRRVCNGRKRIVNSRGRRHLI